VGYFITSVANFYLETRASEREIHGSGWRRENEHGKKLAINVVSELPPELKC